ncbi:MAG: FmdE family protein [Nitrospinota bacterium]
MPEGQSEWKQDFFDKVKPIVLKDPLAYILGAMKEGDLLVFRYADAVKLAGHSCAAVSGAYKITAKALKLLYGDDIPVRGDIKVLIKGKPTDLAYGPMSQVISFITGAAPVTGFRGIGGDFKRQNLLIFDEGHFEYNTFVFQRVDNGKGVRITYDTSVLPEDNKMGELMSAVFSKSATREEHEEFINLWQGKVKKILLEDDKYPGLFKVEEF